jgi:hypothetical protein
MKEFEKMQKLAFGKAISSEEPNMLTENILKDKIKELVYKSLDEAKKKKKKDADVAPQEDIDIDIAAEPTDEVPTEPSMDDTSIEPTTDNDVVRDIQNLLQDAFKKAQQLPDNENKEKTINQISNTVKMFINTQVLGQQSVAESLDEMIGDLGKYDYLSNALNHVWNMGKGNNSIDFDDMARSIIDDLESRF